MAKIKFGMMMTDARGKLGGQVFSKNRGGAYVRTKVTPGNPQSIAQSLVRSLFGTISKAWSALSVNQSNAWNAAVNDWKDTNIFGDSITPSGKNLHQKLNQNARSVGYSSVNTPPAKVNIPAGLVTEAVADFNLGELLLTGNTSSSDVKIVLRSSGWVSKGTRFVKNRLRRFYFATSNSYVAEDAFGALIGRFGEGQVGDQIFLGVKYVAPNGQTSTEQIVKITIA